MKTAKSYQHRPPTTLLTINCCETRPQGSMSTPCHVSLLPATTSMGPLSKSASTFVSARASSLIFSASVPIRLMEYRVPVGAPCALRDSSLVYAGNFYILDVSTATVKAIKTVEELRTIVGKRFTQPTQPIWVCVVRTSEQDILLLRHSSGSEEVFIYQTINGPHDPPRSGYDCAILAEKRVGIVGLGSLGSKIATTLARAGVGRFELVDGEILHSGNLERHDADWRDVGRHKSELMAHRLRLIHPGVKAHSWLTALGAQISSQEAGNVHAALAGLPSPDRRNCRF